MKRPPTMTPDMTLRSLMTGARLWMDGVSIDALAIQERAFLDAGLGIVLASQGAEEMVSWRGERDPEVLQAARAALDGLRLLLAFLDAQPERPRYVLAPARDLLGEAVQVLERAFDPRPDPSRN